MVISGELRRSCRELSLDLPYIHESREMIIDQDYLVFLNIRLSVLPLPSSVLRPSDHILSNTHGLMSMLSLRHLFPGGWRARGLAQDGRTLTPLTSSYA